MLYMKLTVIPARTCELHGNINAPQASYGVNGPALLTTQEVQRFPVCALKVRITRHIDRKEQHARVVTEGTR